MAKAKFYTVWKGCIPGVYSSWIECRKQVHGFEGAVYKSFNTKEEAEAVGYRAEDELKKTQQDLAEEDAETELVLAAQEV